jgi:transcriptional regulator with XRE-family HTH domain
MSIAHDIITNRIKHIRKSKRRSMHDCATILGMTRETYHNLESGTYPFTLPELELLAIFLGVEPTDFLDEEYHQPYSDFLNEEIRPRYLTLREKMIRARIAIERVKKAVTLEEISQATLIPVNILQSYETGEQPVTLENLVKISTYLDLPLNALLAPFWKKTDASAEMDFDGSWQPEFVEEIKPEAALMDDPYQDLLKALKILPPNDQAQIAKLMLEKLKSM